MITRALHARDYDRKTKTVAALWPVLCPEGMVRQLNTEPYEYVGPLSCDDDDNDELVAVVRYRGWLYAVGGTL